MDNRINDMAAPGCSHWAPLPIAETRPALPLLQTLSGVRNTALNMHRCPEPPPAVAVPLYQTPPQPGYRAPEQVVAEQLRHLVSGMDRQPSAQVLAQLTGMSEVQVQQILSTGFSSAQSVLPRPASPVNSARPEKDSHLTDTTGISVRTLDTLCRTTLAKEDGRMDSLRLSTPQKTGESDRDYAGRLVLFSDDIEAIAVLTGLSLGGIHSLRRAALAINEGRAKMLRTVYPQRRYETHSGYVRRLVGLSDDKEAIAAVSGHSLGHVTQLKRSVKATKDGRMERLQQAYPRRDKEGNSAYIRRLIGVSKDNEAISAVSGAAAGTVILLRRTISAEKDGRARAISQAFPPLHNETSSEYVRRLIPLNEDIEAISAASGMSLGNVRELKRIAAEDIIYKL